MQTFNQVPVTHEKPPKIAGDEAHKYEALIAYACHELRTPVHAVLGWATLLCSEDDSLEPRQRQQGLDAIARNARLQARLLDDLLDASSVLCGNATLECAPLQLDAVVAAALESVCSPSSTASDAETEPSAQVKQLRFRTRLATNDASVMGDPERLHQVVANLLSNAIKFSPHGGTVELRSFRDGAWIQLEVADEGPGVEPELEPVLFEPFRQGRAGGHANCGRGLGLAIARGLAELHGGSLELTSSTRGACFALRLPVAQSTP